MTTYGIIFMSLARESILDIIFFKSLRADPATKTTDDLVGVIIPFVPRLRWRGVDLVRERWWEGRRPIKLRLGNHTYVYIKIKIIGLSDVHALHLGIAGGM